MIHPSEPIATSQRAQRIVEDAWEEVRRGFYVQSQLGIAPTRLPDLSFAEAERRSAIGKLLLERIAALDQSDLPHELALTLRTATFRARIWSREAEWYWTVSDPMGLGFFGMFLPTAYCGGFLLTSLHGVLNSYEFTTAGDLDRYLGLIADYATLIDQFTERTTGQAERGIYLPRPQLEQARRLVGGFRAQCDQALQVAPQRLASVSAGDFPDELARRIEMRVLPAFDRLQACLGEDYAAHASEAVGLAQYPGGDTIYAELVRQHTTLDLSAEEVHARGLARMANIEAEMLRVRSEVGFTGDGPAFLGHLNADPRWRATTVEGVAAVFQRYIDRLRPRFAELFSTAPSADYGVAPLVESMQDAMTFGYYHPAGSGHPQGTYYFNGRNLTRQALFNVAALTYHELVPGHHLHLATQQENLRLHPLCVHGFVNAYNEGWAEYAATLAGEIGMYAEPEERYGRLVMDAFLTSRLVVDTGMNAFGWSLERARDYMRAHSGMAEAEILTETVRYSCDIPAQALAYKLGDTEILALRERMRSELGGSFDLRVFHATVLGPGALPLPDLSWHVSVETERLRRTAGST